MCRPRIGHQRGTRSGNTRRRESPRAAGGAKRNRPPAPLATSGKCATVPGTSARPVGAKVGTIVHHVPTARRTGRILARLLAPLILLGIAAAVAIIVHSVDLGRHPASHAPPAAAARRVPPYWTVRPGDTLAQISAKTGLSVDLLQAYNPTVNALALTPGERLSLWRYPPKPRRPKPKPPLPTFWVVRPGQSFGSIAASTGINIVSLEQLNPKLKAASLQPGDRVRLHH